MMVRGLSMALLVTVLGAGCKAQVVTARNSVHPVLLGPVRAIGSAREAPPALSRWHMAWKTTILAASDNTSTTGQHTASAPGSTDFEIYFRAQDQPHSFTVSSLRCRGYAFFAVAALYSKIECKLSGDMLEATEWAGRARSPRAGGEP